MNKFAGFPKIAPDAAALCNLLAGRQWFFDGQFRVFGSDTEAVPYSIGIVFQGMEALPDQLIGISAETGFGSFDLFVAPELVSRVCDLCLPGWEQEPAAAVRTDWLAMYALSQVLETIGLTQEIEAAWAEQGLMRLGPQDLAGAIGGTVFLDGAGYAFAIRTWSVQADTVTALANQIADSRVSLADPGFQFGVQTAPRMVALGDFRILSQGDILLLPSGAEGIPIQARLGPDRYWDGTLGNDGVATFQGQGNWGNSMQEQDYFPSELSEYDAEADGYSEDGGADWLEAESTLQDAEQDGMQPPAQGFPLEDLPVRLDFKLASKTLTLADFSRLAGGSVMELEFDLNTALTIEANGTPVGTGQLVQIGDSIGLQIAKWHPKSIAADE
ncbi:FliM/FliN family flagellar motor switch protein (plasmid) [Leisingera sp. S132]|uniref:FliM/FliN family flagellar motor switch protein n=1 Tax=Leisingera sp. S132 TaxID=2867016 RepID=UPI0021A8F9F8|nr:FliM/FliN family flagellar motor switch protein [Leisingera sp. S132]UWQ81656.1 FliM/FliN family flagellar motor switch protein [Leisingera sp. S132]